MYVYTIMSVLYKLYSTFSTYILQSIIAKNSSQSGMSTIGAALSESIFTSGLEIQNDLIPSTHNNNISQSKHNQNNNQTVCFSQQREENNGCDKLG
jgi:hypothetical protein